MSNQPTQVTTLAYPVADNAGADISSMIRKYLYHWPLYIVGLLITIAGAYYYLQITSPVYPILATLEFNVPTIASTSGIPTQSTLMQSINPTNKPIIVENEIEVMQSQKIMYQLVNDLQLWVTYTQKSGLQTKDLYKASPFNFKWIKQNGVLDPDGVSMKVTIKNKETYSYTDEHNNPVTGTFSKPVNSTFGTWELRPTALIGGYIDSTITVSVSDPDAVASDYTTGIKVTLQDKDAPFVNLAASDVVPQRGKDILNNLMALYQKTALEVKNLEAQKTLAFINVRLDSVERNLIVADKELETYKAKEGITDPALQNQDYLTTKDLNLGQVNDNKIQLGILNTLDSYAKSSQNDQKLPPVSATLLDPSLAALYDKLSELQLQREQLIATTPPDNPIYIPINRQMVTLKKDFKDKIEVIKASLTASRKQLETNSAGLKTILQKSPEQARLYNALLRDQVTKEKLYTDLLTLREEVSLRYGSSVSDSQIVDDAHAGLVKWPKGSIVYALAFVLGLVFPTGLIYLRESLNDRIITRKQIEDEAGVPIIGELTYQDSKDAIVVTEGRSKFLIGEQFRTLRTNLFHLHGHNGKGRVTLFTSSIGGEGKSFISSNLAITLAYASRKVILLEMDLRKPKVAINFGLSPEHTGISNFLEDDNLKLAGLAQPSGIPGLDILTCGPILPNPSELLEKARLDELISGLKEIYDDIIIDSPPIHLVTDAIVISRVTDTSLYVVRQGYTYKNELEFIGEIYASNRLPKFNVVFNGVKSDKHGYGYNYSSKSYGSYNTVKEKFNFGKAIRGFVSRF